MLADAIPNDPIEPGSSVRDLNRLTKGWRRWWWGYISIMSVDAIFNETIEPEGA